MRLRSASFGALVLAVIATAHLPAFADPPPQPSSAVYWLWAIDGRFVVSVKPCATNQQTTNPAHRAIIDFVGSETYVNVDGDKLSLTRSKHREEPAKHLVNDQGEPIGIWYQGARTWIVSVRPAKSPAFATVTLVMEQNAERKGAPKCFERWIAPVSPNE